MRIFRRRKRWSAAEVERALAIVKAWYGQHPGELVWFAHDPDEEAWAHERYDPLGIPVVAVYPQRLARG